MVNVYEQGHKIARMLLGDLDSMFESDDDYLDTIDIIVEDLLRASKSIRHVRIDELKDKLYGEEN